MRWMTFLCCALFAAAIAACGNGDCTDETCDSFCGDVGSTAPDPGKAFQDCVQNAGPDGGDLVLVDDKGAEQFRCRDEHDDLGQQVGTCVDDFAAAKASYCGC